MGAVAWLALATAAAGLAQPLLKARFEDLLSRQLSASVQIGRVGLSPFGITLHQVRLRQGASLTRRTAKAGPEPFQVTVDRLTISGWGSRMRVKGVTLSLGGIPLQARGEAALENGRCEGWFKIRHPLFSGWLEASGQIFHPILLGWVETKAFGRRHFVAELEASDEVLFVRQLQLTGGWDASGSVKRQNPQTLAVQLDLFSGRGRMSGQIGLRPPYGVHGLLRFKGIRAEELLAWALPKERKPDLTGHLEGEIALQGPLKRLETNGRLIARQGAFGNQPFEQASFQWKGVGPRLTIQNSHVNKPSGVLLLDGAVDLRKIGRPDFFQRVKLSSMEKGMTLSGWRMDPFPKASGLEIHQMKPGDQASVSLAYGVDTQVKPEPLAQSKVQANIPLSDSERLKIRLEGEEGFLGVERRGKF